MRWSVVVVLALTYAMGIELGSCDDKYSTGISKNSEKYSANSSWSIASHVAMTEGNKTSTSLGKEIARRHRVRRHFRRFMLPLLLAYKLKFFTLIPILIGGLVLLTGTTGLAGFFFALFAAVMGLKGSGHHHHRNL